MLEKPKTERTDRKAVPLPDDFVDDAAVRKALDTYADAVRDDAIRPRDDVPERREEERVARLDGLLA